MGRVVLVGGFNSLSPLTYRFWGAVAHQHIMAGVHDKTYLVANMQKKRRELGLVAVYLVPALERQREVICVSLRADYAT